MILDATGQRSNRSLGQLFVPCLIVFFSGFCVMTIELIASQLVAPYIGRSLETWTTVIGAILAGISIGNYLGGRLADRFEAKKLCLVLFLISAVLALSTLFVAKQIGEATSHWMGSERIWAGRVLTVIFVTFLLPGTALGTISPVVVKWALSRGFASGQTVGTIYAWNTFGSIAGTFLTGFWLMTLLSMPWIIGIAAGGLLLIGISFLPAIISEATGDDDSDEASDDDDDLDDESSVSLLAPCSLVFVSGFAVMLLEICASRVTAGYAGNSIFTWTSIIGVILAGIAIGNWIGGRLGDRFKTRELLGSLFLLSSMECLATLGISNSLESLEIGKGGWIPPTLGWGSRVMLSVFCIYFLPAAILGSISPVVAKWALDRGSATGKTVGVIYSWNTVGSIAGTFLTGFYLISFLHVSKLLPLAAIILGGIGTWFTIKTGRWSVRIFSAAWVCFSCLFCMASFTSTDTLVNVVLALFPAHVEKTDLATAKEVQRDFGIVQNELKALKQEFAAITKGSARSADEEKSLTETLNQLAQTETKLKQSLESSSKDGVSWTEKYAPQRVQVSIPYDEVLTTMASVNTRVRSLSAFLADQKIEPTSGLLAIADRLAKGIAGVCAPQRTENFYRAYGVCQFLGRRNDMDIASSLSRELSERYYDESRYFEIGVSTVDAKPTMSVAGDAPRKANSPRDDNSTNRRSLRSLRLDALVHGFVDIHDYKYLHYEYEHIYASVSHRHLNDVQKRKEAMKALFLGGGAYTFPRYMTEFYGPQFRCDIAEIDPRVTEAVVRSMGMHALRGKTVLFVTDATNLPLAKGVRVPVEMDLRSRLREFWNSLLQRSLLPSQKILRTRAMLANSGAIVTDANAMTSSTGATYDYVFDARAENPMTPDIIAKATAKGAKQISEADVEALLREPSHPNIVTTNMDARQFVMQSKEQGTYDLIYGDAFNDFSVPPHLTTVEFNTELAGLLKPDGIFLANVIDIWSSSRFMGPYLNTLQQVYKKVYLLNVSKDDSPEPPVERSTFVIICSNVDIDLTDLGKRSQDVAGLAGRVMTPREMHPVECGGREFIRRLELSGEGGKTSFPLPANSESEYVEMVQTGTLTEFGSRLIGDGKEPSLQPTIAFAAPPPKGLNLYVRVSSPSKIAITSDGKSVQYRLFDYTSDVITGGVSAQHEFKNTSQRISFDKPLALYSKFTLIRKPLDAAYQKIVGDGVTKEFPVDVPKYETAVLRRFLWTDEYQRDETKTITLKMPVPNKFTLDVRVFGKPFLFSDNYCPVDNLLSDVAASRSK